jgi:hypothetical protein
MRKRNGTRKFRKLRKSSKNYSTRRNKSGGALGTLARYFTSDGRLLEEFKKKIRDVILLRDLLDTPDPRLEVSEIMGQIRVIVHELKKRKDASNVNYGILKRFVDQNNERLYEILQNTDMQIEKRDFYEKIREEVSRLGEAVVGKYNIDVDDSSSPPATPLPPARSLPPLPPPSRPSILPDMGNKSASKEDKYEETTNQKDEKVYVLSGRPCPSDNADGEPPYFTCDYPEQRDNAICKLCFKSKIKHIPESQEGGSRRRRRTMRSRKNKTRRNGKCRACRCPGGCKRSTCPCYRGRSKPCCTKRCRSRGHGCRC